MHFFLSILLLICTNVWANWSVSTFNIRNFDNDVEAGKTNLAELTKIIKSVQSDVMAFEEVVNVAAFQAFTKPISPLF